MLAQRHRDVLADREAIEKRRELKREPDLLPELDEVAVGEIAQVAPAHGDAPGIRHPQSVEEAEDRRLTRAGEADQTRNRTFLDFERAILQHDFLTEPERHAFDLRVVRH
jgi:hypothetical protein